MRLAPAGPVAMVECISARIKTGQTGSKWQKEVFNSLSNKHKLSKAESLQEMFKLYVENQVESNLSSKSVSYWDTKV